MLDLGRYGGNNLCPGTCESSSLAYVEGLDATSPPTAVPHDDDILALQRNRVVPLRRVENCSLERFLARNVRLVGVRQNTNRGYQYFALMDVRLPCCEIIHVDVPSCPRIIPHGLGNFCSKCRLTRQIVSFGYRAQVLINLLCWREITCPFCVLCEGIAIQGSADVASTPLGPDVSLGIGRVRVL